MLIGGRNVPAAPAPHVIHQHQVTAASLFGEELPTGRSKNRLLPSNDAEEKGGAGGARLTHGALTARLWEVPVDDMDDDSVSSRTVSSRGQPRRAAVSRRHNTQSGMVRQPEAGWRFLEATGDFHPKDTMPGKNAILGNVALTSSSVAALSNTGELDAESALFAVLNQPITTTTTTTTDNMTNVKQSVTPHHELKGATPMAPSSSLARDSRLAHLAKLPSSTFSERPSPRLSHLRASLPISDSLLTQKKASSPIINNEHPGTAVALRKESANDKGDMSEATFHKEMEWIHREVQNRGIGNCPKVTHQMEQQMIHRRREEADMKRRLASPLRGAPTVTDEVATVQNPTNPDLKSPALVEQSPHHQPSIGAVAGELGALLSQLHNRSATDVGTNDHPSKVESEYRDSGHVVPSIMTRPSHPFVHPTKSLTQSNTPNDNPISSSRLAELTIETGNTTSQQTVKRGGKAGHEGHSTLLAPELLILSPESPRLTGASPIMSKKNSRTSMRLSGQRALEDSALKTHHVTYQLLHQTTERATNHMLQVVPLVDGEHMAPEEDLTVRMDIQRLYLTLHPLDAVEIATNVPNALCGVVSLNAKGVVVPLLHERTVTHSSITALTANSAGVVLAPYTASKDLDCIAYRQWHRGPAYVDPTKLVGSRNYDDRCKLMAILRTKQREAEQLLQIPTTYTKIPPPLLPDEPKAHSASESSIVASGSLTRGPLNSSGAKQRQGSVTFMSNTSFGKSIFMSAIENLEEVAYQSKSCELLDLFHSLERI